MNIKNFLIHFLTIKNKTHNLLIYFYLINQNVIFCYMQEKNKSNKFIFFDIYI